MNKTKANQLFGVKLPQTNRPRLRYELRHLRPNQKATLYFLYSEFLLRANRNLAYKEVLNRGVYSAIDGKGLHWSMWRMIQTSWLAKIYTGGVVNLPFVFRTILFWPLFLLELFWNGFLSFFTLVFRFNLSKKTGNQLILGRDFSYDLFTLAEEVGWKTLVIGGSNGQTRQTRQIIQKLYPGLEFDIWSRGSDSRLMRDLPNWHTENISYDWKHVNLNTENLFDFFPDLLEAKNYVDLYKPDLILVCLGGASGKQEFFIDNLYQDEDIHFTLATGVGAALDHLGAGAKQHQAPNWMVGLGLEWLYRLIFLPYRRGRVLDSVFSMWWWTTLQEFMLTNLSDKCFVNIISSEDGEYLVRSKKDGCEFVMTRVKNKQAIAKNYQAVKVATGLDFQLIDFDPKPTKFPAQEVPVNVGDFVKHQLKFDLCQPFVSVARYRHLAKSQELPQRFRWVSQEDLGQVLSYGHQKYWRFYQNQMES